MSQARQPRGGSTGGQFAGNPHTKSDVTLGAKTGWPPLDYEERPWDAEPEQQASRRQRLQARGPYLAAIAAEIATLDPVLDPRTLALAEMATLEMVRFDTDMGHDPLPFSALLLRSESASSSQIENLTAGARRIALARLGDTSSSNAALVASNVRAMQAAVHFSQDLSVDNIALMHHALLSGSNPSIAGQYRDTQVWIRGNSPHTAEFVPPHHDRVPKAMEDLVTFMRRDDIPVLTQAAIAHAQFETIHPFADGNGRTGRAIVSSLLKAKEVTRKVTVPVSSGLLTDTRSYFNALDAYREGDVTPIVERFAESSVLAVDNGRRLAEDIRAVKDSYEERAADAPTSVRRILELLPGEPAVTADMLAEYAGLSTATSYRAIERLQEAGILAPAGKIKGISIWVAPDILAALDNFADRAGRRSWSAG